MMGTPGGARPTGLSAGCASAPHTSRCIIRALRSGVNDVMSTINAKHVPSQEVTKCRPSTLIWSLPGIVINNLRGGLLDVRGRPGREPPTPAVAGKVKYTFIPYENRYVSIGKIRWTFY